MVTEEESNDLYKKLRLYRLKKTPLMLRDSSYTSPEHPCIGTFWEADCQIVSVGLDKFSLIFEVSADSYAIANKMARSIYPSITLPIGAAKYLITLEEFQQTLSHENAVRFNLGDIVYLRSTYREHAPNAAYPVVGTNYERHGKITSILYNKFRTKSQVTVKWFSLGNEQKGVSRAGIFRSTDLMTVDEYTRMNRKEKYMLLVDDPLVPTGLEFTKSDGYFRSVNEQVFIPEKYHKQLFNKWRH